MRFLKKTEISGEFRKFIKFTAYDTLIDFGANRLPVLNNLAAIISDSIFIMPIQAAFSDTERSFYNGYREGSVMYVNATGHYIILYDENLPADRIRWIISKLIYLIRNGSIDDFPNRFHTVNDNDQESNIFAYYFTCPDIILSKCNIINADDIITYCQIPFNHAAAKSKMIELTSSSTFRRIEDVLLKNFRSFINRFIR
jgi:hypothetical protein